MAPHTFTTDKQNVRHHQRRERTRLPPQSNFGNTYKMTKYPSGGSAQTRGQTSICTSLFWCWGTLHTAPYPRGPLWPPHLQGSSPSASGIYGGPQSYGDVGFSAREEYKQVRMKSPCLGLPTQPCIPLAYLQLGSPRLHAQHPASHARHPHSKGHPASTRAAAAIACSSRHLHTV